MDTEFLKCAKCRSKLKTVLFEMYANRADRDDVQDRYRDAPVQNPPPTYVGTFGGLCYYNHMHSRRDLGLLSYRRVIRLDGR